MGGERGDRRRVGEGAPLFGILGVNEGAGDVAVRLDKRVDQGRRTFWNGVYEWCGWKWKEGKREAYLRPMSSTYGCEPPRGASIPSSWPFLYFPIDAPFESAFISV